MDNFYIFDLIHCTTSRKHWKTYGGALKNARGCQIVSNLSGISWILRHPEWIKERLLSKDPHTIDSNRFQAIAIPS